MELAFRFVLSMMLGISILIALAAALEFRRELALFDADLLSDHRVLARALVPAFTLTWAQEGPSDALRVACQHAGPASSRARTTRLRAVRAHAAAWIATDLTD